MHILLTPCSPRTLQIIVIGMCEPIYTPCELVSIPLRHVACHLLFPLPFMWAVPTAGTQEKPPAGDICLPHQWIQPTDHACLHCLHLCVLTNHGCSCSQTHRYSRLWSRTNWIISHCYKERERKNRSLSWVALFICQWGDQIFFLWIRRYIQNIQASLLCL